MKRKMTICILTMTTLLLSGCASQQAQMKYIGAEAAKTLALEAAGLTARQVDDMDTDMDTRDGLDYYQVKFVAEGKNYCYDVDALTGTIIENQPTGQNSAADTGADAGNSGSTTSGSGADAENSSNTNSGSDSTETAMITEEEAKAIALAHAGLKADQVTFLKSGLDYDDGMKVYDLEFYTQDQKEYDYDINPYTGEILDFDHDAEYYTPPADSGNKGSSAGAGNSSDNKENSGSASSGDSQTITADQAKAIALAQVPGATAENIKEFETDYDDGRLEYEGKIYYNHMEYEFEIDGYSGAIRSWDVESIND